MRMEASPNRARSAAELARQRDTLRFIILPMAGVGLLVVAGAVIIILLPERLQVSLIADWLLTILFLCPMALCLFPICILMIAAVVGMNRVHDSAAHPLQRLENLSVSVKERSEGAMDAVSRFVIEASVRFAFIERLLGIFDPPAPPTDEVNEEE
jgi:hypothetical protein